MTRKILYRRRKLLPWWMKFFIWIFLFLGASAVVVSLLELIGTPINLWIAGESSIYGMETYDRYSPLGLFITLLILFKGYTAFAMWTEKDHAIKLGLIDAIVGIVVCVVMLFVQPIFALDEGTILFNFRFELLFLIPYLLKCRKIRKPWEALTEPVYSNIPSAEETAAPAAVQKSEQEIPRQNEEAEDSAPAKDADGLDKEDPRRFMPK